MEDAILRFVRLAYRLRLYREWLDYVIVEGGRDIGRLYEDRHSRRWFWLITVYVNPRLRIATSGRAAIEGAKAQFLANRQKCQEGGRCVQKKIARADAMN
ncbi:MAG: hypothetical protein WAV78_46900 [Xanthobacteraceae bacterium]